MAGWSEQDNAYAVAAAYDYAAAAVQPLCSLPGCAHDSPGCEAWRRITMGGGADRADGGEVFFCYSSGGLRNSGDAAADAELAAWQAEYEGAPVAHIDVCRADGSGRRRLVEFPALDDSEAGTLQMWAADDRSLYVTVRLTNDPADSGDDTRASMRSTGAAAHVPSWRQTSIPRSLSAAAASTCLSTSWRGRARRTSAIKACRCAAWTRTPARGATVFTTKTAGDPPRPRG